MKSAKLKKEKKKPEAAKKKKAAVKKTKAAQTIRSKPEKKLRVLILEDNPADAELMERQLKKSGFAFVSQRVENKGEFLKALKAFKPDLILADYSLPKFNALHALELQKIHAPLIPFIVVTGSVSEEVAVECMKQGTDDYLLKDRLARLGEAVRHAMTGRRLQAEKVAAEETLRESEENFVDIFQTVREGIAYTTLLGKVISINSALEQILDMPKKDIVGKNILALTKGLLAQENAKKVIPMLEKLVRGNRIDNFQIKYKEKVLEISSSINRKTRRLTGVIRDITERKHYEEALLAAASRWRTTFDSMNDAVCLLDENGAILQCNRAMNRLLGLSYKTIIGRDCLSLVCGPRRKSVCGFRRLMKDHKRHEEEIVWRQRWFKVAVDPIIAAGGRILGAVHIMTDITVARETQIRLRENATRLSHAQRIGRLGSWEWNLKGNTLEWSDELYRIWGVDRDFPLSFDGIAAMIHPEDQAVNQAMVQQLLSEQNERGCEFRIICPDGAVKHIYQHIEVTRSPSGQAVMMFGIMQDISERKQAEQKLAESEQKFRTLYENAPIAHQSLDSEGNIMDVNPAWLKALGYRKKEIIGNYFGSFLHPDWKEHFEKNFPEFKRLGYVHDVQFKIKHKDGHYLDISFEGCIGHHPDGSFKQTYCVFQDISERKRAEEQICASLLEKEVLLKEIHHRVKNNLQVISGLLTLQAQQIDDERLQRVIKDSQHRIWTMALIHQTLYQSGSLAAIDMADYIRSLAGNLLSSQARVAMPPNIVFDLQPLRLAIDKAIPLALIVNELLTNAMKHAFADGRPGEIRISLRGCSDRSRPVPTDNMDTARRAPTYELTVADNGVGLPAGFDAKNQKSLGLQLVTMLTKQLDGSLAIESRDGTTMRVSFETNEKSKKQA